MHLLLSFIVYCIASHCSIHYQCSIICDFLHLRLPGKQWYADIVGFYKLMIRFSSIGVIFSIFTTDISRKQKDIVKNHGRRLMSGKSRASILIITLLVVLAACGIIMYISSNGAPSGTSASNNTPAVNPSAVASNEGNPLGEASGDAVEPALTAEPAASQEPIAAPTAEISPTPTPEATPASTPQASPTPAASPNPTASVTPEATPTPSHVATPTNTPTPSPTPLATPVPMPSQTPIATPSATPESTMTPEEFREKCKNDIMKAGATLEYYHYGQLDLYVDYFMTHPELSIEDAILQVNMGLNRPFYTEIRGVSNIFENYALITKYMKLDTDDCSFFLECATLNTISGTNYKLLDGACTEFEEMRVASKKAGIDLIVTSGFTTYEDQEALYNDAVNRLGTEEADRIVERAGHSYAQIGSKVVMAVVPGSKEEKWLLENGPKYGFTPLCPKGKENITGYKYNARAWHYVGPDIAKDVKAKGLTYEEWYFKIFSPGSLSFNNSNEQILASTSDSMTYFSVEENGQGVS